jgi:peroxiredoxin
VAVRAPDFREAVWFNSGPLRLADLRGRVVLLEFFTYGCINCMNNLRTIQTLHERCGGDLVVIGVHSAKFAREQESAALAEAVGRLGIAFAVVGDADHALAGQYAVRGWPTTVLIDRRGYIAATFTGECKMADFKATLEALGVTEAGMAAVAPEAGEGLRFPQKILCETEFVAVASTGADEVWICGYDGTVRDVYREVPVPMGMAWDGRWLYVACRDEGTVLRIDRESGRRETVLHDLRAPFDLEISGKTLFVAEAGAHRITAWHLGDFARVAAWGNRFEALRDGPLEEAQLAQPSGMNRLHDRLWFVDAESSALRYIEGDHVHTAVGEGLHTSGDSDEGEILLQHPQGVAVGRYGDGCGGGRVFVADTYNDKVKVYDPDTKTMMTLLDTLHEPGGIAKKGCTLYIADTNAHAIVAFDLQTMSQRLFL